MIRFLVDAQLSKQLVARLASNGHSASHVFDHLDRQADDLAIAAVANRIGACVVTKDADFVDLAQRGLLQHTLVWLRMPNLSNDLLWLRVERELPVIVSAVHENQRIVEVL